MSTINIGITAEQVSAAEIALLDIERRLLSGDALSQKEREFYEQVKRAEELILAQI